MATIERKPLPPPNSRVTKITEADRAEIIARANDVIDHYLNGPGSYFDSGTRKPLVGEPGDNSTVQDLNNFRNHVIASKQFADDPNSIMGSVVDLIDQAINQVEKTAQDKEGRDGIAIPLPDTIDPIDDPRVTSPRALSNAALPISLPVEGNRSARPHGQQPQSSMFRLSAPTVPIALSDNPNSMGGLAGRIAALAGIGAGNPGQPALNQPAQQPADDASVAASSKPQRYLIRRIAGQPDASAFDTGAAAVPFVPPDQNLVPAGQAAFDDRFGDWTSSPVVNAPHGPYQTVPQASRPLGIFSGKPTPDYPFPPPIWDFPDKSGASAEGRDDWLERLLRTVGAY
jgi:hypothetical protein